MIKPSREQIQRAVSYFEQAEAIWIGAGAGLSVAAGVDFSDEKSFARDYPGMLQYGVRRKLDMMGVWDLPQELTWGYYLPHVKETRFGEVRGGVYKQLLRLAEQCGNYFVKTTNADGLFERNGFPKPRIFTPQGDYCRYQCLTPCTQETWSTESLFATFLPLVDKRTQQLPRGMHPKCPRCGGPTFLNVRGGDWFVETPYEEESARHAEWLAKHVKKRLLVLDLGSGFNTPMWIRWPAENLVAEHPNARLVRVNLHSPEVTSAIADRAVSFASGADVVIDAVLRERLLRARSDSATL